MTDRKPRKGKKNSALYFAGALLVLIAAILVVGVIARADSPQAEVPETIPTLAANPYSEDQFYYGEDGFLRCRDAETALGVDVSEHQGEIDWQAVKDAGVEFAIIRVGYRGYDQGGLHMDNLYLQNMEGAIAAGLDVGVYFYSQATTPAEAKAEAAMVIAAIDGFDLAYPAVYDWEYIGGDARTANMTSREVTDCAIAFCELLESEGFPAAVYFNQSLAQTTFRLGELQAYDFWLAQYKDTMTFPYDVKLWQYTCEGTVPGIKTNVDIDLCFVDGGQEAAK